MNLLSSAPHEAKLILQQWLVPLFLLFNIVGWMGLPGREANRSQQALIEKDLAALGRSIWAGWWLGVLLSLVGITAGYEFLGSGLKSRTITSYEALIAGLVGGALGVARGVIPRLNRFRTSTSLTRRRLLVFLVVCAVAVSITCGVFYYNSCELARGVIASAYTMMLIGYAATFVLEVGK
jgi:hypothetical protein